MATITVTIPTPCGSIAVQLPAPVIPPFTFPPPFSFTLPDWGFPLPDCSCIKHAGSAPEPEEDDHPPLHLRNMARPERPVLSRSSTDRP